jgi:hypothetical protein
MRSKISLTNEFRMAAMALLEIPVSGSCNSSVVFADAFEAVETLTHQAPSDDLVVGDEADAVSNETAGE